MPARPAATPRTPVDAGACGAGATTCLRCGVGAELAWWLVTRGLLEEVVPARLLRCAERLGRATARSTLATDSARTTGATASFGFRFGLALTTPVNPISPNVGETTAAREEVAVETATASSAGVAAAADAPAAGAAAAGAAAGSACLFTGDADAGRANEATRPPATASAAETLPIGLAERETADDSAQAGLGAPGARWRPGVGLGTCVDLSRRLRGELSGSGGRYAPGPRAGRPRPQGCPVADVRVGFTPRSAVRRPGSGSPAPAKRMCELSGTW